LSRITVRRALGDLTTQGLVERSQGVGSFVQAASAPRERASLAFVERLRKTVAGTTVTVLGIEKSVPPPDVAAFLGVSPSRARAVHVQPGH